MKKLLINKFRRVNKFIVSDVWDIELSSLSALRGFGVRALRVIYLVFKGFREDECPLHASALTFNTLLAVVPIFALALALARVFGGAEIAQTRLHEALNQMTGQVEFHAPATNAVPAEAEQPDETEVIMHGSNEDVFTPDEIKQKLDGGIDSLFTQVERINFAALGSVGLILLLWMVVAVLGRVEASFNTVWGVSAGRPILRKFTDYMFMVIVLPFLITMASSFSIMALVTRFTSDPAAAFIKSILDSHFLNGLMVLFLTTATFTILIKFMPNTKVHLRPALAGGIVAALMFIFWLWFCATVQVGVAKYSKLYGGFAIVPIVLFWVFVSWEIILFGAEVAFAVQNCATYKMEQGASRANVESKIILSLSVIVEAARVMLSDKNRFEPSEFAAQNRVPVRFLNEIVDELANAGYLAELSESQGTFVLLKTPATIKVKDVIDSVMYSGVRPIDLGLETIDPKICQIARTVSGGVGGSSRDATIEDMLGKGEKKG